MAVVYAVVVIGDAQDTPVSEIAYQPVMLWCIGISVVLSIIASIVVAIATLDQGKSDLRDKEIHRKGEYFGQYLLVIGAVVALGLTMWEVDHFWIANALFVGFVLSGVTSAAVKIVAYRRGL
ncbi:MAG: hypothetical protein ACXWX3_09955 [Actinomycetota bacterium]